VTQLFLENNGERYLPVINPLPVGIDSRVPDAFEEERRRLREQIGERDVIELDRRIDDRDGSVRFTQRRDDNPSPFFDTSLPPGGFGFGSGSFSLERDVVANIYAANEASAGGAIPGGRLDLVA